MKGKVVLPAGFKYSIDHEGRERTPVLTCKVKDVKQIFYLPIDNAGNVHPFTFNWQIHLGSFAKSPDKMAAPSIEINFMYHMYHGKSIQDENNILDLDRIFIRDEEGGYSADFDKLPDDAEFDAQTNHFTKPKRLALKVLKSLLSDVKLPSIADIRQCYFFLLKKHKAIVNERVIELTEEFLYRMELPNKTKTSLYRHWRELRSRPQKDGTIK